MICLLCDSAAYIKTTKMLALINISENNISNKRTTFINI